MSTASERRVIAVSPMPPEKCAYALARYSRSPDSIHDSLKWVRAHDSSKFLESFYFNYGHASIADLGHVVLCFEGVSDLAATEIEDEPLWDGQAKSSRYHDFSRLGFITPPDFDAAQAARYQDAGSSLLAAYQKVHELVFACLREKLPRPEDMKEDAYRRNVTARAFDVARYLLFWGVPTNIGQVTSIRTLERQIRRLKASEYAEVRELGDEVARACAERPGCAWDEAGSQEALAPTLAKFVDADAYLIESRRDLAEWARQNLPPSSGIEVGRVDLLRPADVAADIVATLLYPATDRSFRELYEWAAGAGAKVRAEVMDLAVRSRTMRDDILRHFRGGPYVYDIVMDTGAYRDLHRHRRCHQFRQAYTADLGYETPPAIADAGAGEVFASAMEQALQTMKSLPAPGADYLLPFGCRSRFLFKMDFAEAEYISKLRSWVKGHFSYRAIAWEMKCKMEALEPELGRLIEATPPWVEEPLRR